MTFSIKNEWKTKREANETNKLSEKNMTELFSKF